VISESVAKLLERDAESLELRRALGEAQHERGQLVLIEAPAGLGKSSLLWATAVQAAEAGFLCMRTRASELEHDFAYGCIRRLLEPVVARSNKDERDRLFEDAAAHCSPLFIGSDASRASLSSDAGFALPHGLYWLLNNLSRERVLALCIDDLQWCDVESLRFLNYLAPRLDGLALIVLATVRARENVTPDLARLLGAPEAIVLRPMPLSVDAVAALCELRLASKVSDEFAAACHAATNGNPFFLETLLREAKGLRLPMDPSEAARVQHIGPAAVARAVLLRLASAPPAATALVRAIAVLGGSTSVVDAARLAGLTDGVAAHTADSLVDLAILKRADVLEFAHPIIHEAIYQDIGAHECARVHALAARILSQRAADDERVAAHIVKAEPSGDADRVALLRRVAARALVQGAPAAAVAWLSRALAEAPLSGLRPELLLELGSAEFRLGMPAAIDHLAEALATLQTPRAVAVAARQLADALSASGQINRSIATLEAAFMRIEGLDRELALLLEAELAAKMQQHVSPERRIAAAARLARHSNLAGASSGERLVLASLAFERARACESESEAVRCLERPLASGGLLDGQLDVVGPFYALMIGLLATDGLDLAIGSLEHALADARVRGSIPAITYLTVHRGWFYLRKGSVAQAEADARAALELMDTYDIQLGKRFALALLMEALIEDGQIEVAAEALQTSGLGAEIPPTLANNLLFEARGRLHLARGDARSALSDLREFGRQEELRGAANPLASRWRSHACLALQALGDEKAARELAAEELARARRWGSASGLGMALRAAAIVEGSGNLIDHLTEAVRVLEKSPAKLEYARALVDLGAAQRRANRRTDARTVLEHGLSLARSCGAKVIAEHAALELRAAGGRTSETSEGGLDQLTVSERRVAELAAMGRSNPQIAQTLFVTRKTVETHLGRVYSKLCISGRAELARLWVQAQSFV
jgi:DNA-binding CsgD family transcriptional regulator